MTKAKLDEALYWKEIISQNETRLKECEKFAAKDYAGKDERPRMIAYNNTMTIPLELVEPIRNMLIGFYKQEIEEAKKIFDEM